MQLKTYKRILVTLVESGEAKDLTEASDIAAPMVADGKLLDGDETYELADIEWRKSEPGKCAVLAAKLDDLIREQRKSRSTVIKHMAAAGNTDEQTVRDLLGFKMDGCPTLDQLEGFAAVLNTDISALLEAAMANGCEYEMDGMSGDEDDE